MGLLKSECQKQISNMTNRCPLKQKSKYLNPVEHESIINVYASKH